MVLLLRILEMSLHLQSVSQSSIVCYCALLRLGFLRSEVPACWGSTDMPRYEFQNSESKVAFRKQYSDCGNLEYQPSHFVFNSLVFHSWLSSNLDLDAQELPDFEKQISFIIMRGVEGIATCATTYSPASH